MPRDGLSLSKTGQSELVRKSKRCPRRPVIDDAFDDGDDDEEIQYLKRHMVYRPPIDVNAKYKDNGEVSRNQQNNLKDSKSKVNGEFVKDLDCRSLTSDGQRDYGKGEQKECVDLSEDDKRERYLTTRHRAFLSGRDGSAVPATTSIEFPKGLPPPPRKQKKKLSEVEQQLKKVETAQRRKLQVEKAPREAQAEAIRKILGQDSSRKKQENKMKKRRDEIAQGMRELDLHRMLSVKVEEGRFEILTGSFTLNENGDERRRTGGLGVSLAGTKGHMSMAEWLLLQLLRLQPNVNNSGMQVGRCREEGRTQLQLGSFVVSIVGDIVVV